MECEQYVLLDLSCTSGLTNTCTAYMHLFCNQALASASHFILCRLKTQSTNIMSLPRKYEQYSEVLRHDKKQKTESQRGGDFIAYGKQVKETSK
jgi:hypothetical protein